MALIEKRETGKGTRVGLAKNVGEYIKCSIGIAPNRYLAKVATELHKPDGLTILSQEDLPHKLYGLKLRDLPGIGRNMDQRLHMAGIADMKTLFSLDRNKLKKVWGSVWGERMWYYLRGVELPELETTRSSIGHSHVMAPELRDPLKAKFVARRLMLKAASRLRRLGYYASCASVAARLETGPRLSIEMHCYRAQDSRTFLKMLDDAWNQIMREARGARIRKVSITLYELTSENDIQPELFDILPGENLKERLKSERLSRAMDKINHRFGRDSILLGMLPSQGRAFSGSKIAFTRIPDREEFLE